MWYQGLSSERFLLYLGIKGWVAGVSYMCKNQSSNQPIKQAIRSTATNLFSCLIHLYLVVVVPAEVGQEADHDASRMPLPGQRMGREGSAAGLCLEGVLRLTEDIPRN